MNATILYYIGHTGPGIAWDNKIECFVYIMPHLQDRSFDLLTCSPKPYHCAYCSNGGGSMWWRTSLLAVSERERMEKKGERDLNIILIHSRDYPVSCCVMRCAKEKTLRHCLIPARILWNKYHALGQWFRKGFRFLMSIFKCHTKRKGVVA